MKYVYFFLMYVFPIVALIVYVGGVMWEAMNMFLLPIVNTLLT